MKQSGIGPQVEMSLVPFTWASHLGYLFLTHSQMALERNLDDETRKTTAGMPLVSYGYA